MANREKITKMDNEKLKELLNDMVSALMSVVSCSDCPANDYCNSPEIDDELDCIERVKIWAEREVANERLHYE